MTEKRLPNSMLIHSSAILSCILFWSGGIAILFSLTSLLLARKSENIYQQNPDTYSNIGKIKKGKIIAIIGMVLNLFILGVTIWTLSTIGWEAWSEEFVRKWNEGLQNNSR